MKLGIVSILITIMLMGSLGFAHADDPFKLCTDYWPPYEHKVGRTIEGICVATVRAVLANMGQKSNKIVSASWGRCLQCIKNGDDHAAFSGLKTKERMQFAIYPEEPLTTSHWVFFIREDRSNTLRFRTLNDLEDRRIGVVKGFYYPPDLLAYAKNHAKLEYASNTVANFRKLLDDRLDFVFEDLAPGLSTVEKLAANEEIIPLVNTVLVSEPLYVLFSKKSVKPEFVKRFSEELKRYKKTEEYKAMFRPYDPWVELTTRSKQ